MFWKSLIIYPFDYFFKKCDPKLFVFMLKNEYPQTIAFILSFCKSKVYIKKVLGLLNQENFPKESLDLIINYLKNCKSDFDAWITREIEKYCEKKLKNFKNGSEREFFRKNIKISLKKETLKEKFLRIKKLWIKSE
jgi:flagellar motor switch protein FliG